MTIKTTAASKPSCAELDRPISTIEDLIRRRALELGDSPLIGYPNEGLLDFEEHSAHAIDKYADAAVQKLQALGLHSVVSLTNPILQVTVAYIDL